MPRIARSAFLLAVAMLCLAAGTVSAAYPDKPIRLIVPFPAGVTSAKRTPSLPNVPTIAEAGLPRFDVSIWLGVLAPARTPSDIVARVNSEIRNVMAEPEMKAQLVKAGIDPLTSTPDEFAATIKSDMAKWGKVVKASGARVD